MLLKQKHFLTSLFNMFNSSEISLIYLELLHVGKSLVVQTEKVAIISETELNINTQVT